VAQKLFSIRAKARAASVLAARDPARAAAEMDSVAALSGAAHAELRAVISGLAPPDLGDSGLAQSLRRYAALAAMAQGVRVRFTAADVPSLGAARDASVYRLLQEALHNALRHADADEVRVSIFRTGERLGFEVSDDGRGFDPSTPASGLGLASMHERATAAGGTLTITSAPGRGTKVRLDLPVTAGGQA
jgi:signal transduction histidine kinase